MAKERVQRRLAAILAADVAGYSRLMGEDEVEYLNDPLDEPDPGYVLICCSMPKTNLVLEA